MAGNRETFVSFGENMRWRGVAVVASVVLAAACGDPAAPPAAPVSCGAIPSQTINVGETASVPVCFNDENGDMVSLSAQSSNVSVATVTARSGSVAVTAVSPGTAQVTVTGRDPGGLQGTVVFSVMVPNRAPQATGTIAAQTVVAGETEVVDVSGNFTEPDGQALSYSASSSNQEVATVAASGARIAVTAVSAGMATVTVTATDPGGASAAQSFEVTVPNRAPEPTGTIPAQTVQAGDDETVDLAPYFTDPDGDALDYSASSSAPSVATASVSGTAVTVAGVAKGTATITVTATDPAGESAEQMFQVTVPNRAPEARGSIPAMTVRVGDDETVNVAQYFTDPDGDALVYSASSSAASVATASPSGSTVTVTATGKGTAMVTVTATDPAGESAEQTFRVTVPNRRPERRGSIPATTVEVGKKKTVALGSYFTDPDGDALEFSASSSDPEVVTASTSGGVLTLAGVARGTAAVTVTATDPDGGNVSHSFPVTVPNRAPEAVGTIPKQSLTANGTETVGLAPYFTDPDGDMLSYAVSSANPQVAVGSAAGGVLTIRAVGSGSTTITVTARDPGGLAATQTVTVDVANRRPVPVGTIPAQSVVVGQAVNVALSSYFDDPDGDALVYSAEVANPSVAAADASGATLTIRGRSPGNTRVTVTARDPSGLSATQRVSVSVSSAAAPDLVFSRVNPQAITVAPGSSGDVAFTIRNAGDAPSEPTESRAHLSNDATITTSDRVISPAFSVPRLAPGATATLDLTINVGATTPPGTAYVGMCADPLSNESDTGNNCSSAVTLTVTVSNNAPRPVGTIPAQTVVPGQTAAVDVSPYFADPDGDVLTYTAVSADTDTATVQVIGDSLRITGVAKGTTTVTVTATDPGRLTASQRVSVTVAAGLIRLTNNSVRDDSPAWSRGGKIAFVSWRDPMGGGEIYVMNTDGTSPTRLTNNTVGDWSPAWSPDGSKIAFGSRIDSGLQSDEDPEIYVMNANGSGVTQLTSNGIHDGAAAWSPDGSKIAFESGGAATINIHVMNADGTGEVALTSSGAFSGSPTWSANGSKIAFASNRTGTYEIHVMNADGTGATSLTIGQQPAWSPDGTRIAFISNPDGKSDVYVMNADGTAVTNLTNNSSHNDGHPAWSPDGTRIAFASDRDGNAEIYVMTVPTSSQQADANPAHHAGTRQGPSRTPSPGIALHTPTEDRPLPPGSISVTLDSVILREPPGR